MNELDQIFNFYDRYAERVFSENASTGANALNGTVVPANEIWVVTSAGCMNSNRATTYSWIGMRDGSTNHYLAGRSAPPAAEIVSLPNTMILKEGDQGISYLTGCVAGDDIFAWYQGYKMRLK